MNILEKIKYIVSSIILIFILIFFILMYVSGNMSFVIKNYDKKEDKPLISDIEYLISPIIENLPNHHNVNKTIKNESVGIYISYKNIEIRQKKILLNNIVNQHKWKLIENNKGGSNYCYNQFLLNIYEDDIYGQKTDDYLDFLFISISWSQYDDICRKNYYKKQLIDTTQKNNFHPTTQERQGVNTHNKITLLPFKATHFDPIIPKTPI